MEAEARTISGEFPSDVSPEEASADKPASRVRADFEGLLELAERLQQSYEEQASNRQSVSVTGQIYGLFLVLEFLAADTVVSFLLTNLIGPHSSHLSLSTYIICIASLIADGVLGIITISYFNSLRQRLAKIKIRMYADERDISEVVELLREIEPVFAKEEKLSVLERVQIRIRLSRFGIGSSARGNAESTAREQNEAGRARKSRVDQELMKPF